MKSHDHTCSGKEARRISALIYSFLVIYFCCRIPLSQTERSGKGLSVLACHKTCQKCAEISFRRNVSRVIRNFRARRERDETRSDRRWRTSARETRCVYENWSSGIHARFINGTRDSARTSLKIEHRPLRTLAMFRNELSFIGTRNCATTATREERIVK